MSKSNARRKPAAVVKKPAAEIKSSTPNSNSAARDKLLRAMADDSLVIEDFAETIFGMGEFADAWPALSREAGSAVHRLAWELADRVHEFTKGLGGLASTSRESERLIACSMSDDLSAITDFAYVIGHFAKEPDRYGGDKEPTVARAADAILRRVTIIERTLDEFSNCSRGPIQKAA